MRKFLIKIRKYSLTIISITILSFLANYLLIDNYRIDDENVNIIFAGDSNMETSVNDKIINNSINLAKSGDSYLYTYLKIKKLIQEDKTKVDTIVISFSPHNIFENDKIISKSQIFSKFKQHYPVMNFNELELFLKISPKTIIYSILSLPVEFSRNILKVIRDEPVLYGKYLSINKNQVDRAIKRLNAKTTNKLDKYSQIEILYLNKIIDVVKNENKVIMFMNPPKRNEILNHDSYQVHKYYNLYDSLYYTIPFMDLSKFKLDKNEYADLIHLNKIGAQKFSNHINEVGLKKLITKRIN